MDLGVKQQYSSGIHPVYGFDGNGAYLGQRVGVTEGVRAEAGAAMQRCGVGQ